MVAKRIGENLNELALAAGLSWQHHLGADVASLDTSTWPETPMLLPLLSQAERVQASEILSADEHDHFVRRRLFQRLFTKYSLGLSESVCEVPMLHERDNRPRCSLSPDCCLSFSSAGRYVIAAASRHSTIGVDIERLRPIPDALGLANRFFGRNEAAQLESLPAFEQSEMFIRIWSAKEASLKALGTGVVHSLESFSFSMQGKDLSLDRPATETARPVWHVEALAAPAGYVAYLASRVSPDSAPVNVDKP
jgi:4'-phosphopantetheinyl transferase